MTILGLFAIIFSTCVLLYTIWNYKTLTEGEGWGLISMIGLFGVGLLTGFIDFLLQVFITKKTIKIIIDIIIIIGLTVAILVDIDK